VSNAAACLSTDSRGGDVLVLVRHGESTGNAAGRLVGRLDAPLTDLGRSQVAAVGKALAPPARIVTSPLARARATAEAIAVATGVPLDAVVVDERWVEADYGVLDGCELAAVPADAWHRLRTDTRYRPEGGESLADVGVRVRASLEELFAVDGNGARGDADVVVVSHVSPVKAAVCWALGLPDDAVWRLHLATASVTRIGWSGGPVLHAFNETPWRTAPPGAAGGR
jgi:broad specificity phosphatase PhoE